ncbi:MAG: SemiSWEET transporter [Methanomassiliicoccales archaeon]|jgi:MtN3 and saliva related transmembrane protein|nr:SemiSWEET transporter [Methanomassiliicoccales archaeon]
MDQWTAIGLLAGFLTTIGFVPQIIKGYRSKSMGDLSLFMPILIGVGMSIWLIYGIWLDSLPLILWNAVALTLNIVIIVLILRYGRNQKV